MSTGSRDFDTNSDYLDSGTWGFTSNFVSMSGWVYLDTIPSGRDVRFFSKADGTAANQHDWMIGYQESGGVATLRCRSHRNATTIVASGTLSTGQWYHVAFRAEYNTTTNPRTLYQNGVSVGSDDAAWPTLTTNTNAVYVGNQPTSIILAPDGRLSDWAVWSVDIGAAAITALAAKTTRPSDYPTGLQVYYSGGDITDSSGNARDATNNGTTLSAEDPGFGGANVPRAMLLGIG